MKSLPKIPIDTPQHYPDKPLYQTDINAWRQNGQDLANAYASWFTERRAESSYLNGWSDQAAWNAALLRSDIIPRFNYIHCSCQKRCEDLPRHEENYCGARNKSSICDTDFPRVFDYVAPIGDDLVLLARYLDPREDIPIFEDLEERNKYVKMGGDWGVDTDIPSDTPLLSENPDLHVRIKVIWAFALDWIKRNILRPAIIENKEQAKAGSSHKKESFWTPEHIETLRVQTAEGKTDQEIADYFYKIAGQKYEADAIRKARKREGIRKK